MVSKGKVRIKFSLNTVDFLSLFLILKVLSRLTFLFGVATVATIDYHLILKPDS